jgi:hypothetical protein
MAILNTSDAGESGILKMSSNEALPELVSLLGSALVCPALATAKTFPSRFGVLLTSVDVTGPKLQDAAPIIATPPEEHVTSPAIA